MAEHPDSARRPGCAEDRSCWNGSCSQPQRAAILSSAKPLCSEYFAVVFDSQVIAVRYGSAVCDCEAFWAVGVLVDGQCDLLGTWLQPFEGPLDWAEVFADLTLRGVEKIRCVVCDEPDVMCEVMHSSYPAAKALPSNRKLFRQMLTDISAPDRRSAAVQLFVTSRNTGYGRAFRSILASIAAGSFGEKHRMTETPLIPVLQTLDSLRALAPRIQRALRLGESAAQKMSRGLSRAVDRRGWFGDHIEAVAFVVSFLERSERRLWAHEAGTQAYEGRAEEPVRNDRCSLGPRASQL